jgi:hypothetical protein
MLQKTCMKMKHTRKNVKIHLLNFPDYAIFDIYVCMLEQIFTKIEVCKQTCQNI